MEHKFVKRHVTDILPSAKVHLNQEREGIQSTKSPQQEIFEGDHTTIVKNITNLKNKSPPSQSLADTIAQDIHNAAFPPSENPNMKSNYVAYKIVDVDTKNKSYTDLIGRFHYCSSRGNQYILAGYHYDGNTILVAPLKTERRR